MVGVSVISNLAVEVTEMIVSGGTILATDAQEAKVITTSKIMMMFLFFMDTLLCKEQPNGLAQRQRRGGQDATTIIA
jgi:hypothetical protein